MIRFSALVPAIFLLFCLYGIQAEDATNENQLYKIEGTATLPREVIAAKKNWRSQSRVLVDHGRYIGFIREDGHFVVSGIPHGSYIVEISNVDFVFEPVRVDITSKGKFRARKLNVVQPSAVTQLPYPLKLVARQPANYFRPREEWRVTDMLMNPMVLMMVVPLLLIVVLPKLINTNDPQLQREMQQSLQMPKYEMPDMSDMLASWFGGGKKPKKPAISSSGASSSGNKKRT